MAAQMMLDYLAEKIAASQIEKAVFDILKDGKVRTKDLGGSSTTSELSGAIVSRLRAL